MDFTAEITKISDETKSEVPNNINKREYKSEANENSEIKRQKLEKTDATKTVQPTTSAATSNLAPTRAYQSPKKRLDLQKKPAKKEQFIYGNYNQYYSYRNKSKDFHDIRLDVFGQHAELFRGKEILDIGCNNGFITMEVAKRFPIKSIVGLDIDRSLINQAIKNVIKKKKALPAHSEARQLSAFPFNVHFVHGNYVLRDDVLLEIEREQYDVILCLSITKWIHLNFGDAGLKQAFRRMYLQLRPGGKLILEAQSWHNYGRRKNMTETIAANYKAMTFFPKAFTDYLKSASIGFTNVELMAVPEHDIQGFKRPIHIFTKA